MTESQVPDPAAMMMPGEAADLLGVSTTTLATWAEMGAVEAIRLPSGHRRYVAESVRALASRIRGAA